jgi:CBS domain-containing protein
MEENKISSLAVVERDSRLTGVVHLLSLLRAGIA